jgi:hypothetical protein
MLEHIQDVSLHQGLLGRIFNFGNIIPTSASGVGTGQDIAGLRFGVGAKVPKAPIIFGLTSSGEKGVTGFRSRPHNCLFGVESPKTLNEVIMKMKFKRSESSKLEDIKTILKEKKEDN